MYCFTQKTTLGLVTFAMTFLGCSNSDFAGSSGSKQKAQKATSEYEEKNQKKKRKDDDSDNSPPKITSKAIKSHNPGALKQDPKKFDLTNWKQVNWNTSCGDTNPEWVIEPDRAYVKENSEASALISDIDSVNVQIEGQFSVGADGYDNDYIGIVFGYQDLQRTYVFDWLKEDQGMKPGMCLQAFNFTSGPSGCNLFHEGRSGELGQNFKTIKCANTTPWVAGTEYTYILNFRPGHIKITIKQGSTVLDVIDEKDDTYKTGKFGLYANSQDKASFKTPTIAPVLGDDYEYQVVAEDEDGDEISYELLEAPKGMKISKEGLITWKAKDKEIGKFKIEIEASDEFGGTDIQKFTLEIEE